MDAPWHIRLLGTLEARQGDLILTRFVTSRVAALLARLALFPSRTHPREELADLLWPEATGEAGRLNLRVALASLRRQMEPPSSHAGSIFIADRNALRLYPDSVVSDASQFESLLHEAARTHDPARKRDTLTQALALHSGELLPGFYDEWVIEERERLQALLEDAQQQYEALAPSAVPRSVAQAQAALVPAPPAPVLFPPPAPVMLGFPSRFTRFFGRAKEQARLAEMLRDPAQRLVTLLGPGGSGKTRLAIEAARQAAPSFAGSTCFVALADIGDSALIPAAAAAALRLTLAGERPAWEQIADYLGSAPSLFVLDNLEHLGAGGAAEIHALLEAAPRLTCLVTSRQTLSLEGEREILLSPLPVPAQGLSESPVHLSSYSSVQLFTDRAQAVRPDFQITPHNAEAVAAVCRSLEGLPLALELAAARIQALTPAQMQVQLEARLDFLTSRRRDLPPRHRSLRAALEWSVQLLSAEQRRFFACLSAFRGGWTAEAAAAAGEVPAPLTLLEELCERSLISAEETPLGMHFRMLESLREFGEEQLTAEEKTALSRRHAAYFQTLAADMDAQWSGLGQPNAQAVLDAEMDNLRAALSFCRTDAESSDLGLRLAGSLGNYWTVRGLLREGLSWLAPALAGTGSVAARVKALSAAGWLAAGLGEYLQAEAVLTEAIALGRELGNPLMLASALRMRGVAGTWHDRYPGALPDLEESLALGRETGDAVTTALALNSLGVLVYQWHGDKLKARALYEEALPLFLRVGDRQRASYSTHNLGCIAHELGDYDRAAALLQESLTLTEALGDLWHRAYCLRSIGDVRREQGDLLGAAQILEEGCELCRRLGDRMTEAGTVLSLATVRRRQGDRAAAAAAGRAGLLLYQALGHPVGRTEGWMNLADTAAAFEHWEDAAALLSAAAACRTVPAEGIEVTRYERLQASACTALTPAAFEAAWERGRTLTCDEYGLR